MHSIPRRSRKKSLADINVVPYIDVMLVLLVIFMITAPLLSQGVDVRLPEAAAKALPAEQKPMVLTIDHQGQYFLNIAQTPDQPLAVPEVIATVTAYLQFTKAKHETPATYVKADRDVNYGQVMNAMILLQRAGAAQVGLLTAPPAHS